MRSTREKRAKELLKRNWVVRRKILNGVYKTFGKTGINNEEGD
jgi:hypothetical protein